MSSRLERFLAFSAEVTAYPVFELRGTGMAKAYLETVVTVAGDALLDELLDRYDAAVAASGGDEAAAGSLKGLLRRDVFSDARLGPVARNIVKMWYLGIWYELPAAWTEAYGARDGNVTFTVSATAYTEGLLWPAIGANPPGAKAPGFASWVHPPRIPAMP
ncbi:MAG: hypothetical protein ACOYBY_01115 [Dermatophilaceae bacterium]